jgi:hypothetical protein
MRAKMTGQPENVYAWMGMNYFYHGLNGSTYLPKNLDTDRYPDLKATKLEEFLKKYEISSLNEAYMF